jgi:hypothetical protein
MTNAPLPLAAPPRDTARPPDPRGTEDHEPHLSGGARYASAWQTPKQPRPQWGCDRARSHHRDRADGGAGRGS